MTRSDTNTGEAARIRERLQRLDAERQELERRLSELACPQRPMPGIWEGGAKLTNRSPRRDKIALFRSLFLGREDVYPRRWENAGKGTSGYAPVCANEWSATCATSLACRAAPVRTWPLCRSPTTRSRTICMGATPSVSIRCWPMTPAGSSWPISIRRHGSATRVPVSPPAAPKGFRRHSSVRARATELMCGSSLKASVAASLARRIGALRLTEAMTRYPDIGFGSYDRFFPSQDTLPQGGFGNLIALPLQGGPRRRGNSVFLDVDFEPCPDQWSLLSTLRRLSAAEAGMIVDEASRRGRIVGLHLPLDDEDGQPWTAPPSRRSPLPATAGTLPGRVAAVLGDQIYVERDGLPPGLVNRIVRLAAFQNPAFYAAQAMRRSTFGTRHIIACAELHLHHIALPRGCLDAMEELFEELGIGLDLSDERQVGRPVKTSFLGTLTPEQTAAADALLAHETGVLAASTAFGKTVVAASLIAARGTNTLVLVHRRQLVDQWIARLGAFLDLTAAEIGCIGGGTRKPTGVVDVAIIQSLVQGDEVDDLVADYGHLIVDECHHLSAPNFEKVAWRAKVNFVLGLSATVTRKDGHHPIVFMQCGPVRYRASARAQALKRPFSHCALLRPTAFRLPERMETERPPIQDVYAALAEDAARNGLIFDDVLRALDSGRSPLVLTARKDHAEHLADRVGRFARNVLYLHGGMGAKPRRAVMRRIAETPDTEERVLVATGRYIGEGFDDPPRHAVSRDARRMAGDARAVCRAPAPTPSRQAGGAGLRLRRQARTRTQAHDQKAHPRLSQSRLFGRRDRRRVSHVRLGGSSLSSAETSVRPHANGGHPGAQRSDDQKQPPGKIVGSITLRAKRAHHLQVGSGSRFLTLNGGWAM